MADHNWGQGTAPGRLPIPLSTRLIVLERDDYLCQVRYDLDCTIFATQCDHIVERAQGGSDDPSNLRAACAHCNLKRSVVASNRRRAAGSRLPSSPNPGLIEPTQGG